MIGREIGHPQQGTPKCPICSGSQYLPVSHPQYRRCTNCFAVYQFTNRRPVGDYYAEIMEPPDYRRQAGAYRTYLRRMRQVVSLTEGCVLVDVGAGDATFLELAMAALAPRATFAVEASPIAQQALRARGISLVEPNDLACMPKKIVVAFQVIEHLESPHNFLSSLHLDSGDYIVLTSPATDTAYFRLYGKYWRSYAPDHHIVMYCRQTIEHVFEHSRVRLLHYEHCVSGVHNSTDEFVRFCARALLWPLRRRNPKYRRIQLFHGKSSFLAIGQKMA
jgi:hypothetical protein